MATVDRGTSEPAAVWLPPDPVETEARIGAAPASWGARAVAVILDGIIVAVAFFLVGIVMVMGLSGWSPSGTTIRALWALFALAYAILMLAYNGGQTYGKELMRIRVVNEDGAPVGLGRAAGREVLKLIFQLLLFLPYLLDVLWPLWQPENRALHDLAAGTRVVKAPRGPANGYYDAGDLA